MNSRRLVDSILTVWYYEFEMRGQFCGNLTHTQFGSRYRGSAYVHPDLFVVVAFRVLVCVGKVKVIAKLVFFLKLNRNLNVAS